jgi:hypothetical protein
MQRNAPIRNEKHPNGNTKMADITDAGPRLKAMNDRLEELRAAADQADSEYRDEIARLRLTSDEREAVEKAIGRELDAEWYGGPEPDRVVALRGLLERLG